MTARLDDAEPDRSPLAAAVIFWLWLACFVGCGVLVGVVGR